MKIMWIVLIILLTNINFCFGKNDPLLEIINLSLEHSSSNQSQKLNQEIAENNTWIAYAKLLPTLSISTGRTYTKNKDYHDEINLSTQSSRSDNLTLSLDWTLWNNFENINSIREERLNEDIESIKTQSQNNLLKTQVIELFFKYQELLTKKNSLDTLLKQSKDAFEEARNQEKVGQKTKFETIDAEIDVMNAQNDAEELDNELKKTKQEITHLINKKSNASVAPEDFEEKLESIEIPSINIHEYTPFYFTKFQKMFPEILKNYVELSTQKSPDLQVAKLEYEKNKISLFQSKLSLLPEVTISAGKTLDYGYKVQQSPDNFRKSPSESTSISINISYKIWDFFQTPLSYSNSEKNFQLSRINYLETLKNSGIEIQSIIDEYIFNEKATKVSKLILDKSEKIFDFQNAMYRLGKITLFQRQNAMNKLNDAKADLAEKAKNQFILASKIMYELGIPIDDQY